MSGTKIKPTSPKDGRIQTLNDPSQLMVFVEIKKLFPWSTSRVTV
jgi:hypothetical protein